MDRLSFQSLILNSFVLSGRSSLPKQLNRGSCETPYFKFLLVLPHGCRAYRTDNSNRRRGGARAARVPYLSDPEDFIQISRHSIKQSIYSGFAFAGTSRFPATSTTCKFAGIYSNSSRLGMTRQREREAGERVGENERSSLADTGARLGGTMLHGCVGRTHTDPGELAFPLGPLLEAAGTMATECLPTLTQSSSEYLRVPARTKPHVRLYPRGTWSTILLLHKGHGAGSSTIKLISLKLLEISSCLRALLRGTRSNN